MYAVVSVLVNFIMLPDLIYYNEGQSYNTMSAAVRMLFAIPPTSNSVHNTFTTMRSS